MKFKTHYLLEGVVKKHPEGFGFFIPSDHPDAYIPSGKMGSALTNDWVCAKIYKKNKAGPRSYYGAIHSVLKRHTEYVIGPLHKEEGQLLIKRHNLTGCGAISLNNPKNISVKLGDLVKAKLDFSVKNQAPFKADLVKNFGTVGFLAKDDIKRVMINFEIDLEFPKEVLTEVQKLPNTVREKDFFDRKDLRSKAFVTIDGASAQDFDDAIFVEKHVSFYRLYVAIADVSYYVQHNSYLDKEAYERGNSVYFPGFCSPMLPEKLSADLCSLREGQDRLVMVQEIDFDFKGERLRSGIYPSVIKSRKRFTYGEAQDVLDGFSSLKGEFIKPLKTAGQLAQILLKNHIKNQAINLDIPETLILVTKEGEPQDIIKEKRLFSHIMIEQFMLSANKSVSVFLEDQKLPLLYRIHDEPEKDKLKSLQKFSKILGFTKNLESRQHLNRFLSQYKDHKWAELIHKLVLRSFPQACYSTNNKGHYGLNFSSYTHFTSPIRRYCDLVIHRLIKQALLNNTGSQKSLKKKLNPGFKKELEQQAQFISQRERKTVKAERRVKDIKKARFLKKHVGKSFLGYVSSISSFGFFIAIKQYDVEGLVRFQSLKGLWQVDDLSLRAKNKKSGYQIFFGDKVEVLITACDVLSGKIDMQLLSHKGRSI